MNVPLSSLVETAWSTKQVRSPNGTQEKNSEKVLRGAGTQSAKPLSEIELRLSRRRQGALVPKKGAFCHL